MKNLIYLFIVVFVVGCNIEDDPKYKQLKAERDSLALTDSAANIKVIDFVQSFNEIQENLDQIKEKEGIVSVKTKNSFEDHIDLSNQINDDIITIYELMQKNKFLIEQLQKKLKNSGYKISELEKMITRLTTQIKEQDEQILLLKNELAKIDIIVEDLVATIDTLALRNEMQQETIDNVTEELQTAYYVFGTAKELMTNGVLTKEGGFIGLGRVKTLVKDFNKGYFTKINIENDRTIVLANKKATLITNHPEGSYELIGNDVVEKLIIKKPKDFWSVSKYLVIQVD